MIGKTKLSTIREELRKAFAASDENPLVELDREIRKLKKAKAKPAKIIEELETFRAALAQVVEEPKKRARSKRSRPAKKAV